MGSQIRDPALQHWHCEGQSLQPIVTQFPFGFMDLGWCLGSLPTRQTLLSQFPNEGKKWSET